MFNTDAKPVTVSEHCFTFILPLNPFLCTSFVSTDVAFLWTQIFLKNIIFLFNSYFDYFLSVYLYILAGIESIQQYSLTMTTTTSVFPPRAPFSILLLVYIMILFLDNVLFLCFYLTLTSSTNLVYTRDTDTKT